MPFLLCHRLIVPVDLIECFIVGQVPVKFFRIALGSIAHLPFLFVGVANDDQVKVKLIGLDSSPQNTIGVNTFHDNTTLAVPQDIAHDRVRRSVIVCDSLVFVGVVNVEVRELLG